MSTRLARSGRAPLEVQLHICRPLPADKSEQRTPVFDNMCLLAALVNALKDDSMRWKDITIRCDELFPAVQDKEVLVALQGMPMLEVL